MTQSCFIRSDSLGYTHDLAARAPAHTIRNKSEAAYHHTDLLNERRPMMKAWADYVMPAVPKTLESRFPICRDFQPLI